MRRAWLEPYFPVRPCPFCGKRHRTLDNERRCQDRHEKNYDEFEDMVAGDPRGEFETRELIYQLMLGRPQGEV